MTTSPTLASKFYVWEDRFGRWQISPIRTVPHTRAHLIKNFGFFDSEASARAALNAFSEEVA